MVFMTLSILLQERTVGHEAVCIARHAVMISMPFQPRWYNTYRSTFYEFLISRIGKDHLATKAISYIQKV